MMEYLPPVGWVDVATQRDLDQLERINARFDLFEQRVLAAFRSEVVAAFTSQTRSLVVAMNAIMVTCTVVVLAASRLN